MTAGFGEGGEDREVAVALGANLGSEAEIFARFSAAVAALREWAAGLVAASSVVASEPVGPVESQPRFLNAVAVFEAREALRPERLLRGLLEIEAAHGRDRLVPGGPRTLDLDLLWFGAERIVSDELVVPHPRMLRRRFVLAPLAEVLGMERVVPGAKVGLGELLASSEPQPVEVRRLRPVRGWLT